MKNLHKLLLLICVLFTAACDEPTVFMAGGELAGTVAEVPAVWQLEEDAALAQLETNPAQPYSINLVYVQLDGVLYVYAGDTRTNWVKNIERDPLVKLRIGEVIYPGRALRVSNPKELEAFAAVWASRSMFQRDPMGFEEVWLYRLVPR